MASADVRTDTIKETAIYLAEKQGVDPDLVLGIIECESGFNSSAKNPNSTAKGLFQFINSTFASTIERMGWTHGNVLDWKQNLVAGIWLLKTEGEKPWRASKHCYEKIT